MSNTLEPNFNGLPKPTDWKKVIVPLQQANEKEFRGATLLELGDNLNIEMSINAQRVPAVPPGALVAGPADREVFMELMREGTWTWNGVAVASNPKGSRLILWWDMQNWLKNDLGDFKGESGNDGEAIKPLFDQNKEGGYSKDAVVRDTEFNEYISLVNNNKALLNDASKWADGKVKTKGIVINGDLRALNGYEAWKGDRFIAKQLTESDNLVNEVDVLYDFTISRDTGDLLPETGSITTLPIPLVGFDTISVSGHNASESTIGFRFLNSAGGKMLPAAVSTGSPHYYAINNYWLTAPAGAVAFQLTYRRLGVGDLSTLMVNKGKISFNFKAYSPNPIGQAKIAESVRTKADASDIFVAGGANLINPHMRIIDGMRIVTSTGLDYEEQGAAMTELIPIKGDAVYMIGGRKDAQHLFRFLDANLNPLQPLFNGEPAGFVFHNRNVRRSPVTAKWAQIVFKQNNVGDLSTLMFYEGNLEKQYEKYIPVINPSRLSDVTFRGGYVGTAKDLDINIKKNIDDILNIQVLINNSQDQISTNTAAITQKISLTEKAAPGGVATLNSSGKIPLNQIDLSGMKLLGNYNPVTNNPPLSDGTGTPNNYYIVRVDGTHDFGNGPIDFKKGDKVVYSADGKWILDANREAPIPTTDSGLSEYSQYLRVADTLFNIYNEFDKSYRTFTKATKYKNGIDITSGNIDGKLYKKVGNEFFVDSDFYNYGIVYTKFYGIKSDGVTNDQPAFQALINFLKLIGGGIIHLAPGRVRLFNKGLKWFSNISLKGHGMLSSVLQCDTNKTDDFELSGIYNLDMKVDGSEWNPLKGCDFSDFMIDCSGYHNLAKSSVGRKGMFILGMENCHIQRVYVYRSIGTGFGCDHLDKSSIRDCLAVECGSYIGDGAVLEIGQSGIGIGTGVLENESVTVDSNWCIDNGNYGIFVESQVEREGTHSVGAKIINNHCIGNRYGIGNRGSGTTIIANNSCYKNKRHGIFQERWSNATIIVNNDCSYNLQSGIFIYPNTLDVNQNDAISNNIISRNNDYGICLADWAGTGAKGLKINGNTINDNGLSGILIRSFNRHVVIRDNIIFDNGKRNSTTNRYGVYVRGGQYHIIQSNNFYTLSGSQKNGVFIERGLTNEYLAVLKPTILKDNIFTGYANIDAIAFDSVVTGNVDYILNNNIITN